MSWRRWRFGCPSYWQGLLRPSRNRSKSLCQLRRVRLALKRPRRVPGISMQEDRGAVTTTGKQLASHLTPIPAEVTTKEDLHLKRYKVIVRGGYKTVNLIASTKRRSRK